MPVKYVEPHIQELCDKVVNQLKELREENGVTVYQLSGMIGMNQPNITRIETGESTPNLYSVVKWANAFDCDVVLRKRKKKE